MKSNNATKSDYAVSEVVGGMILILIAVSAFAAIYIYLLPEGPEVNVSVDIEGTVSDEGLVVLEHAGGQILESYNVVVYDSDGTSIGSKECFNDNWKIGEYRFPLENITDIKLINDSICLRISVYNINKDSSKQQVFTWEPCGKAIDAPPPTPAEDPMLISSLRNDTTDEDLICFNYTIIPLIDALTYIYNWTVDGSSITDLLMTFDTNSSDTVRDYSGDEHSGTLFGPTWNNNGVVGGAYQFDGVDNYISIPYCYDGNYIDEIVVEAWIKTDADNEIITSYDRDDYWELGIRNGVLHWATTVNGNTSAINGVSTVNDDNWHHIAVTYDSSSGNCTIYVDGVCDKNSNCHSVGEGLGSGSTPNGFIGSGSFGVIPGSWNLLTYDDFEDGFGNYTDGGRDCLLYTGGTYAHQGSNAADIEDNSGIESSFYHTNFIDVDTPDYTSIKVDFWFRARDFESGEDFWVRYFDGTIWRTVADYDYPTDFVNGQFYHEIVWINETDYTFPTNSRIRFQCDADSDYDDIYIDEVYVNASGGDVTIANYSGIIDEFRIYNRALTGEQIFQNYLCTKDGFTDRSVIVSDETSLGDTWRCTVTPNDSILDDESVVSNPLQIIGYGGG